MSDPITVVVEMGTGIRPSDIIAAISLVVSGLLAVREFSQRPRIVTWMQVVRDHDGDRWKHEGIVVNVANVGRSSLLVESVGERTPTGRGVRTQGVAVTIQGEDYENPRFPLSIRPGEAITVRLDSRFPDDGVYAVMTVKPSWWNRIRRRSAMKRVLNLVQRPSIPPIADSPTPHELMGD